MANAWNEWAAHALTAGQNKAADRAGVYGLDGTCWGATDDAARAVPKDFFTNANNIMTSGVGAGKLTIDNKKYITLRCEPNLILAKNGTSGVTVCKGKQTYVVGIYDGESVQPNNCCLAASVTCDKLQESGY